MHTDGPVIVTGAAGFIGSHLTERLLRAGHRVVGIDNFDPFYAASAKLANLRDATASAPAPPGAFELLELDITDAPAMADVFAKVRPSTVFHLAAKAGVRPSIADPVGYMRTNVLGTASVLEAARLAGARRVIVASSSSVYGNCPVAPFREDMDGAGPISPYAASKRATELLCHSHHHLTGMPVACLRFFTVFGPRQRPDLAISLFMRRIHDGQEITMFGDGSASRDYTFVEDIVSGVLAAADRIDEHGFRIWNLGNSSPIALRDLIASIARVVAREPVIRTAAAQPGDVERTWADLTRSTTELGYHPSTSLEAGLGKQWAWLSKQLRPSVLAGAR
jgi:UDP-glucuronate 4-epimerase